jgi:hypothetical protein
MKKCNCGSGLPREEQKDGYGIFLCFTCARCYQRKMSRWRSDIHTRYEATEPIESED